MAIPSHSFLWTIALFLLLWSRSCPKERSWDIPGGGWVVAVRSQVIHYPPGLPKTNNSQFAECSQGHSSPGWLKKYSIWCNWGTKALCILPLPSIEECLALNDLQKLPYAKDVSFTWNPGSFMQSLITHNCPKSEGQGEQISLSVLKVYFTSPKGGEA